jgi:hypothetical protein
VRRARSCRRGNARNYIFFVVSFFVESIFMPVSAFIAELSPIAGAGVADFMAEPVSAAGFACDEQAATANIAAIRAKRFIAISSEN